jgi:hypothetical protein
MNRRLLWFTSAYLAAVAALVALFAVVKPSRVPLDQVYMPSIATVPDAAAPGATVRTLIDDLRSPRGRLFLDAIAPSESGALWLSLAVALVVGFDFTRPRSPRNFDLLLILLPGVLFYHSMGFFATLQQPAYLRLLDWVFCAVFVANLALVARAIQRAQAPLADPWQPSLPVRPLIALAVLLLSLDVVIALVRPPDDAGYFVNLGAQRLRERGLLPYGDPLLDGSPGAAYGPLMYLAHVPFQWLIDPWVSNAVSPDLPALSEHGSYLVPSDLATKACTIAFHLVGVLALWVAARRLAGERAAWGVVALYCGSLAVLGVGGDVDQVTGMSFVSHIAPASAVLIALALAPRPAGAGVALGIGAGLGFYPAFMAPAWIGHYWRDRRQLMWFLMGFAATGVVVMAMVVLLSRAAPGRTLIGTFLWDTFGHHTDPSGYGRSPFGFWGQRGPVRSWFMQPLAGGSGFTSPAFLIFVGFNVWMFFVTRRRSVAALALASAAVAVGATLIKIHPTGSYLAWFYPLLLVGHFAWPPAERPD